MLFVSKKGAAFVAHWEGFRSCPYLDMVGVPTRGYGETKDITMRSPCVSEPAARRSLRRRLTRDYLPAVPRRWQMRQCERDALASFAYNLGVGAVSDPRRSTLARRLRSKEGRTRKGRRRIFREELPKWAIAGGAKVEGLVRRRAAEVALANRSDYSGKP